MKKEKENKAEDCNYVSYYYLQLRQLFHAIILKRWENLVWWFRKLVASIHIRTENLDNIGIPLPSFIFFFRS